MGDPKGALSRSIFSPRNSSIRVAMQSPRAMGAKGEEGVLARRARLIECAR